MINLCTKENVAEIYEIINDAASAYKGVIPSDRWKEPYMTRAELDHECVEGVQFYSYSESDVIIGVMGIQPVRDVLLIRHAYVRTEQRGKGIGGVLLEFLLAEAENPVLIGTWKAAVWAIRFYEKYGFTCVGEAEKNELLRIYWDIPERQVATSVVLCDSRWREKR